MPFATAHESEEDSLPVYLYTFTIGSTVYRYTSGARNYTSATLSYEPLAGITHTDVQNSGEEAKNSCTVIIDYDNPISRWLRQYVPTTQITLEIQLYELGVDSEAFEFKGIYLSYLTKYPEFKMIFAPLDYTIAQGALQKSFGLNCQHTQYDAHCGLAPADFKFYGSISSYNSGTNIIGLGAVDLTTVAVDYYVGGFVELDGVYGAERAWVVSQTINSVEVDRKMPTLGVGANIALVPSCKGSFINCEGVYSNTLKFLGAPHADKVNPFDASGVKSEV